MKYGSIGSSDLVVSALGLSWPGGYFDEPQAALDAAVDAGITLFDVVLDYEETSEPLLAELLHGRREGFVVAACGISRAEDDNFAPGSREDIRKIELVLERLRVEYVDLFYYTPPSDYRHWVRQLDGPRLAETLGAMQELVDEGKARALGLVGLTTEQLGELEDIARTTGALPVVALESQYNLLERDAEQEILPFCWRHDIGFLAFDPGAGGLLTGEYRRGEHSYIGTRPISAETFDRIDRLEQFASDRGRTLPELAVAAVTSMGFPAVVLSIPDQIRADVAAATWELTQEELGELARI